MIRTSVVSATVAMLAASLTGCLLGRTDVATMVYQVTVDSGEISSTDSSFARTEDPEEDIKPVMVSADTSGIRGNEWTDLGAIVGEQTATLIATPPGGVSASCVIVRDGKEELVSSSGQPGEPVTCEVVTPKRVPGVLRDIGVG